jgi:cysteine desulfurase
MGNVYLDWNATSPPHPEVLAAMRDAAWANPSSRHAHGRAAAAHVEAARQAVADLAGEGGVVLTSGGTEANNLALWTHCHRGGTLVTSQLEHASVREVPYPIRWLDVLPNGQIDLADLERALDEGGVSCVAVQWVNSETGVIQPVSEVVRLAHEAGVPVHCDAVQGWGKLPAVMADTRSLAAHKFRGPKGIGALVSTVPIAPMVFGGSQEGGIRPGTVDPIACAGLAAAVRRTNPGRHAALAPLRDHLERHLQSLGGLVNGAEAPRAPHVTNVSFLGRKGLPAALDAAGVSVSGGCACSAGKPSVAITAMLGADRADSSVRCSIGETTTAADIVRAVEAFRRVLA